MPEGLRRRIRLVISAALGVLLLTAGPAAAPPGDLDPTFDGDGRVTADFARSEVDEAEDLAIQADGKILVAGSGDFPLTLGGRDFVVTRYKTEGSLDPTFSGDGIAQTDFLGREDRAWAMVIQADGKILVAGHAVDPNHSQDFALARYNIDGTPDTSFSGDGEVTTNFVASSDAAQAVAIQPDGKIVLAGSAGSNNGDFALARYDTDGSLDASFDGDGRVLTHLDMNGLGGGANTIAIQPDGRILVGGGHQVGNETEPALARYNNDGSLDSTFGGDGKLTSFGNPQELVLALTLQPDGKIVVAGRARSATAAGGDFLLLRFNNDGSLDSEFDGDGRVATDFGASTDDVAIDLALQVDKRIVAVGGTGTPNLASTFDFALARYIPDGSLDTAFGAGDGKVATDFASDADIANAVAIQKDGRIVAAGFAQLAEISRVFALARYKVCRPMSRRTSIPC